MVTETLAHGIWTIYYPVKECKFCVAKRRGDEVEGLCLKQMLVLQVGRVSPGRTGGLACQVCGKVFSGKNQRQLLRRHTLIHTGEKPHACPNCPYRTNQKCNLNMGKWQPGSPRWWHTAPICQPRPLPWLVLSALRVARASTASTASSC